MKRIILSIAVSVMCSCAQPVEINDSTFSAAELADMYSVDGKQAEKWSEGVNKGYFSPSEFTDNFNFIYEESKDRGFDTGVYFDATLCYFFNQNSNVRDDHKTKDWYGSTDSEVEFIAQYDTDENSIYGEN